IRVFCSAAVILELLSATALARPTAQTTAFTYQGLLKQSGAPLNGSVDLQFRLFDAAGAGNLVGAMIPVNGVSVTNGTFTTSLDFGALALDGSERWLEIAVASPANLGAGPFTTLTPRQQLASAPYAAYALNAALPATYGNSVNFTNAANAFAGSGAGLTALNASNMSTGTVAAARLSGTYNIGITGNAATA